MWWQTAGDRGAQDGLVWNCVCEDDVCAVPGGGGVRRWYPSHWDRYSGPKLGRSLCEGEIMSQSRLSLVSREW